MFSRAHRRGRMNYPCIPSRFPLSYLRRPSWKMPVATNTMSTVKPAIAASRGQVNWCSNCSGTKEMKPAVHYRKLLKVGPPEEEPQAIIGDHGEHLHPGGHGS